MTGKPSTIACVGALLAGLTAPVLGAQDGQGDAALRTEVQQLRAEVAELRQQQDQDWMTQRRAEEVKTLIRDVLSDAETRSSLLQEGMSAGHDGENFYLQSGDGGFRLNLAGQIQTRFIYNNRDDSTDDHEFGFEVPRAKLHAFGHIANPRIGYSLRFNLEVGDTDINSQNNLGVEEALITYDLNDNLTIWGGETKDPFLREELVSSANQLAVERSLVNEVFTMGYVQGIGVDWMASDNLRVRGSINDGIRSGEAFNQSGADIAKNNVNNDKPFDGDNTDFAATGRVDYKLAGMWEQADDFNAWSGEEMSAFVGAAGHYEIGETGSAGTNDDFWSWTVDASLTNQGWTAFAAVNGLHTDYEGGNDRDLLGFVGQAGYNIDDTWEPFVRYEYLDLDSSALNEDQLNLVTVGVNWFNDKNNAKFTADVVWALDEIPTLGAGSNNTNDAASRLGLLTDTADEDNQLALRLQYQLLF